MSSPPPPSDSLPPPPSDSLPPPPLSVSTWLRRSSVELATSLTNKTVASLTPLVAPASPSQLSGYDRKKVLKSLAIDESSPPSSELFYSSLEWLDRQLVAEWRDYSVENNSDNANPDDPSSPSSSPPCPLLSSFDLLPDAPLPHQHPPPPTSTPFALASSCHKCHSPFSATLYRHHCRSCGNSFCATHSPHSLPLPSHSLKTPSRLCKSCYAALKRDHHAERIHWRLCRLRDYTNNKLTPYFSRGADSTSDILHRLSSGLLAFARQIPLCASTYIAVETLDILRLHGLTGIYTLLLRSEFVAAADLLRRVTNLDKAWPLSVHELTAAIFYALADKRHRRGCDPNAEAHTHTLIDLSKSMVQALSPDEDAALNHSILSLLQTADNYLETYSPKASGKSLEPPGAALPAPKNPVSSPCSDALLSSFLFYAPIALNFIYSPDPLELQLLAAQLGWSTLYAHLDMGKLGDSHQAYALLLHRQRKIACLTIRGTATINDIVTDLRASPTPFPPTQDTETKEEWVKLGAASSSGIALSGMAESACRLFDENIPVIEKLVEQGYMIRLTGHSLGGGVACLLGVLVRAHLKARFPQFTEDTMCDLVRVYGFGVPCIANESLASEMVGWVENCVLHDDVVPRISPTSVRKLVKHLLAVRETWVASCLGRDLGAVKERLGKVWGPRWRQSFVRSDQDQTVAPPATAPSPPPPEAADLSASDVFYEAEENLVDDSDSDCDTDEREACQRIASLDAEWKDSSSGGAAADVLEGVPPGLEVKPEGAGEGGEGGDVEIIAETALPKIYIPGSIHHIYVENGCYKIVEVPRKFRELRRFSMSANMIQDHTCKSYYKALLEVRSVRSAKQAAPEWQCYEGSKVCNCCASDFTWASTSSSEAQTAKDKHNCRSCGLLVCEPCSQQKVALPEYGLTAPCRICDSCFFELGFKDEKAALARSYVEGEGEGDGGVLGDILRGAEAEEGGRERKDSRRKSSVVEEMVMQLKG